MPFSGCWPSPMSAWKRGLNRSESPKADIRRPRSRWACWLRRNRTQLGLFQELLVNAYGYVGHTLPPVPYCQGTVAQSGGGPDWAAPVRKSKIVSDYRGRKEWLPRTTPGWTSEGDSLEPGAVLIRLTSAETECKPNTEVNALLRQWYCRLTALVVCSANRMSPTPPFRGTPRS